MSDINMNDAQMSAITAADNQMTAASSMHTNQSDVQANPVGANDAQHGITGAFGSQMSTADAGESDEEDGFISVRELEESLLEAFGISEAAGGDVQQSAEEAGNAVLDKGILGPLHP